MVVKNTLSIIDMSTQSVESNIFVIESKLSN